MFHFSLVHKLQTPVTGEKGAALQTISQDISGVMFFSFSCQIYPASVVFVRPSGLSKLCLWAANLFLKVFAVSPTYCLTSLPPLTVALYTRFSVVHFPWIYYWYDIRYYLYLIKILLICHDILLISLEDIYDILWRHYWYPILPISYGDITDIILRQ